MDRALLLDRVKRLDWWMGAAVLALLLLGILFIYSASYRGDGLPVASFYRRQILWVATGATCFLVLVLFDYHRLGELSWLLYLAGIVLLVLVLLVAPVRSGASRWLPFLGFQIQPSEFAKLSTLVAIAWYLSRPTRDADDPRVIAVVGALAAVPFVLIFIEPDLGTAAVLAPISLMLLYAGGVPMKTLCFLGVLALCLLPLGWLVLDEYQKNRILVFFDPGRDVYGAGWNKMQSQIAVGSGGWSGKGFLAGTQNVLGFLPKSVAPTDFIYSVVAEEMGFLGSALVLSLYAAVILGAMRTALVSVDKFGRLLCVGVATLLFSHVFVNIAMTIGLMPITGLPLPLMSYGGSFMVSTMCGLGMVQSVYVRRPRR
jgi:rod shape determining protein RodA